MDNPYHSHTTSSYETRLDRALKLLQERVEEQEAALEKLRASLSPIDSQPSADPSSRLRQLLTIKVTYESLIPQDPYLPHPESLLPTLLALRSTGNYVKETEKCIAETQVNLNKTQQRLEIERSDLHNAKLIQSGLQTRISSLRGEIEERSQRSPDEIARQLIREMRTKTTGYDSETKRLVKAFNTFIDDYLAVMLAAEELGGPIVGEMPNVDQDVLRPGFGPRGKGRKVQGSINEQKLQRRIDEIWGVSPRDDRITREPWNEQRAAAAEMRELTEQLLNSLVEAEGSGPGAYVELERESAAARFLVRSKVAQFHPKDARRLRLIDFGGELEV